jgi:hypothetical protein
MSIASALAQIAVAMALFTAGCAKLPGRSATAFAETIRVFAPSVLRGHRAGAAAATVIAVTEIALGLALLLWPATRPVAGVATAFCAGLVAVACVGYLRHRDTRCNCFGGLGRESFGAAGVIRALILLALAAVAALPPSGIAAQPALGRPVYVLLLLLGLAVTGAAVAQAAATMGAARQRGLIR